MKKVDFLFAEYAESHQNPKNKIIHWICVPLIFFSILGFISLIPSPHILIEYFGFISIITLLAIALVSIFYFRLSWKIALIMVFIMFIFEFIIFHININFRSDSWIVFLTIFVLSWIGQFYGHKIEGKKPSFLKDLQFLLVGPIWLLSFILKKCNIKY
ncbi:Mpo1 family 2-hydroxy fatty acid dioxygenase [Halpernia frigidisoli]|uniref:Uncharacterized membrane protein YGL010W n=1 Tax=Halpernia frigidisoli TaxID=1125876 RepID=A0A1I3DR20_9FLAO|nr:Mpo1-like protein [Halpernia frigidisoli]SFH89156.1 Uncharacterized membrane protein YGL010W [Halpernia frigidisoli]